MRSALSMIERDMCDEVTAFRDEGKLLEAQRLEQRTTYDIEMMREIGYCSANSLNFIAEKLHADGNFRIACGKNFNRIATNAE